MRDLLADLDCWRRDGEDVALATLVAVHGSAPRLPGARMAVTRSGRMAGSVSGGCVENDVFTRALTVLDTGRPIDRLAPMAKLFACQTFRDVTAMAEQVHGGLGFTVEFDIQLYFRRAKQLQLSWWDSAYLEELVAVQELDS